MEGMYALPKPIVTEAEYLAWDSSHEGKHEFINGEIVAMAGASARHVVATVNIGATLQRALAGRRCLVFASDQRVRIDETGLYAYPDVAVTCARPQFSTTKPESLLNPQLLVEVLSESTGTYDRGPKFAHYRQRPSVQAVVFVDVVTRQVEHYARTPAGWLLTEAKGDGTIDIPSLGFGLPLDEVFAGFDLLEDADVVADSPDA